MSYAFEPGVQYELQNVGWYLILRVLSTQQILVRNIMTDYEEAHNIEDLLVKWDEGQLEFGRRGRNLREVEGCPIKTTYEFTDSQYIDFNTPAIEATSLEVVNLAAKQEMVASEGIAESSVAQLGVPLPPMVEGVTLPMNKELMEVGACLPEPKAHVPEQKISTKKD